jgi:hypothetical protein
VDREGDIAIGHTAQAGDVTFAEHDDARRVSERSRSHRVSWEEFRALLQVIDGKSEFPILHSVAQPERFTVVENPEMHELQAELALLSEHAKDAPPAVAATIDDIIEFCEGLKRRYKGVAISTPEY